MEESKSGEVLVRYLDSMPVAFWAKVVMFLQATSAAALHATSAASSTHTTGTWSPRWEVASERAALAAVAGDASWKQLGWGGANRSASRRSSSRPAGTAPCSCRESACAPNAFAVRVARAIVEFV